MKKTIIAILSLVFMLSATSAHAATKSLNNKENKKSCTYIKQKYQSSVMSDWSNGLATDQDVIKEIETNIKMLSSTEIRTNGEIKKHIKTWLNSEKKTKVSLLNNNVEGISSAMTLKIYSINNLNKLCKLIGK
jgi:hypothetical protein